MSEAIISVEGLGKRYRLGASRSNERYTALRDVISEKAAGFFKKLKPENLKSRNGSDLSVSESQRLSVSRPSDEFWALKDVSFEVKQGEVLGIIGRNGAGKSTLLKILSRITEPTEGRIKIKGRVASLLEVGTGFHPELTGRENIYLNGAILGMHRHEIKAKFDEIVAFAEVDKFLDTPVKRYSSGMYVRLAFAVAAHLEPEILIVDEVLAVGDAEFQRKCLGKMRDVARGSGRTVLFVSHNMGSIHQLCGKGLVLQAGRQIFLGEATAAISRHLAHGVPSTEVKFEPSDTRPSITGISVDEAALRTGDLIVTIHFESPFPLSPVIAGVVVTASSGAPVFGSNPRFHRSGAGVVARKGAAKMKVRQLPLAPGSYRVSAWLGDWQTDYDSKPDAVTFDFSAESSVPNRPSSEIIGYLNLEATWSLNSFNGD